MPGWIIQGVRGEGKSLAAVGKIKEYMARGCPVATNLDLYLDQFLPADNPTLAYRLPDHPRLEDLEILPPAYDVAYKGEDKNGLLVLDELGTWLNSRSWNDKTRLKLLNWLFLSRKYHWDLILLAQDHEMIDAQVRSTCCDYLVQASRMDRQKIPYLAPILEFLGFNAFMPKVHVYHVFYGMTTNQKPVEVWKFTGKNLYDGYDTNQRFKDGHEPILGTLIDMRAVYSYVPVNYLTNYVHIDRLQARIKQLSSIAVSNQDNQDNKGGRVALKQTSATEAKQKAIILGVLLLVFVAYRAMSGGFNLKPQITAPSASAVPVAPVAPASSLPASAPSPAPAQSMPFEPVQAVANIDVAPKANSFMATLFKRYRPRLSSFVYSDDEGFLGFVNFLDGDQVVERFNIKELHSLGVSVVRRPYGIDLIHEGNTFIVTHWTVSPSQNLQISKNP